MGQYIFIAGFCLFCVAISAIAMKVLKTTWVYFLVSTTLPTMALVGVDVMWRGYLDAWADIAFAVSMLIAFTCALGYYLFRHVVGKGRNSVR
jgi:hypothetical protein